MTELEENLQVKITTSDLIYEQVKELGKRMDRLEQRLDKLEGRLEKQDDKIEKLADKIDALRNDLRGASNHGQISTITTIGIALAVIYSLFTR